VAASEIKELHDRVLARLALHLDRVRLRSITAEILARTPGISYLTNPISLDEWPHLVEPYRAPIDEPLVIVAGSQTGKSLLEVFRIFSRFAALGPLIQMMVWPTDELARDFAMNRIPDVFTGLPDDIQAVLEPARFTISESGFGKNLLYYKGMAIGHQHSTKLQSVPASFVILDEVRQMPVKEIRLARERMSGSKFQVMDAISAAGMPGDMLDSFWQETDQRIFYSKCGCRGGCSIAHGWPDTVRRAGRGRGKRVEFCCPKCGKAIKNPREGRWVRTAKRNKLIGFHLPQTLSPTQDAAKLLTEWESCIKNPGAGGGIYWFKSDKLGLIESDPETALVDIATIKRWRAAERPYRWGPPPGEFGIPEGHAYPWPISQGWDCMGELAWGITLTVDLATGEYLIIWIDRYRGEPWDFVRRRIHQYRPHCAVVDAAPEHSQSRKLCRERPGQVWRANYGLSIPKPVQFGKIDLEKEAGEPQGATGFEVRINRGLAANNYIREPSRSARLWLPAPHLYPAVPAPNEEPAVEEFLMHLQSAQVMIERNPKTGRERWILSESPTIDPHGIHALIYAMAALDRIKVLGRPDSAPRFGDPRETV